MSTSRAAPKHDWLELDKEMQKQKSCYPVTLPDGKKGDYAVDTFTLTDDAIGLMNLRAIRDGVPEAVVTPGTYTRLWHKKAGVLMSNTQFEYRTNKAFVDGAKGKVLVTGLGIGMILPPLLKNKAVTDVTVVERSEEVVHLVWPTYEAQGKGKLRVVLEDAYEWEPSKATRFDSVWHDIWSDYGSLLIPEYKRIRAHYRKWAPGVVQQCWAENIARRMDRWGN